MSGTRETIFDSGIGKISDGLPNFGTAIGMGIAEFIGTAMILFFGCMGGIKIIPDIPLKGELSFGFTVMSVIIIFGHISQGHFNPAVTLCAVIYGTFPIGLVPFYIIMQYLGAVTGFALLTFIVPGSCMNTETNGICNTLLHTDISVAQGLLMEFLATSGLIFLCCAVWDERNAHNSDSTPIKFSFFIIAMSLATGPFTGCSMNPARSFAPALINNDWSNHWIYIAGPMLAGFVVPTFYIFLFGTRAQSEEEQMRSIKEDLKIDLKMKDLERYTSSGHV